MVRLIIIDVLTSLGEKNILHIDMKFEFLVSLLICLIITNAIHRQYKIKVYNNKTQLIIINIIFIVVGFTWETIALKRGYWMYSDEINSILLFGVPVIEFLYYLIIPYFVIIIYKLCTYEKYIL